MGRPPDFVPIMTERSRTPVLFDLERDPGETIDLATEPESRAIADDLSATLGRQVGRGVPTLPETSSIARGRGARHDQLNVPARFIRGAYEDHDDSLRSAIWLIHHVCDHLGVEDLSQAEVLDFGCGVKLTEALLNAGLPIKRYVGFDVYEDLIRFLQAHVRDGRFEYFHINAHNPLYNPDGEPLSSDLALPIEGRSFDLITLLSVFTHLPPSDYREMLILLRRYARPESRLFYSLYVDELTAGGHGLMDGWARALEDGVATASELVAEHVDRTTGARRIEPFKDLDPSRPLRWALYSERYARDLIEGTGWRVLSLSPPDVYIQHHFVCEPC